MHSVVCLYNTNHDQLIIINLKLSFRRLEQGFLLNFDFKRRTAWLA
jgi:hypothetical protein